MTPSHLEDLMADWIAAISGHVDSTTAGLYELHARTHLGPFFLSLDNITPAQIADYGRKRLAVVKRATLQKERSTLRGFLDWCAERGHIDSAPEFPALPKKATGTAHSQRRRGAATDLSPEECQAVIDDLPKWSTPRAGRPAFAVRPRFVVMYETGLRPATLDALSVPEHYTRGATSLRITDAIDKARFGRELPLSLRAQAALVSCVQRKGIIFGKHDYRPQLVKAAMSLTAQKRATFTAYDFRHARLTELAETGNLTGAAYMAGHKRVTTTAIYVKPGLKAAKRVLAAVGPSPATKAEAVAAEKKPAKIMRSCEGEDSNLHGSYPASTSRERGNDASQFKTDPLELLEVEAVELGRLAQSEELVDKEACFALARLAIEFDPMSALAAKVLEGGKFAGARAMQLASMIKDRAQAARAARAQNHNRRSGDK